MGFTRKETVQFPDGLMGLVSKENRTEALLVEEKFISDFEKRYGFEKEEETVVTASRFTITSGSLAAI